MFKPRQRVAASKPLSFRAAEDDEEDGSAVVLKKGRLGQAPHIVSEGAISKIPSRRSRSNNMASTGGSYSTEQIQALKSSQLFASNAAPQPVEQEEVEVEFILDAEEMLELSGEEAESFVERLESARSTESNVLDVAAADAGIAMDTSVESVFLDEKMDFKARLKLKVLAATREAEQRKLNDQTKPRQSSAFGPSSYANSSLDQHKQQVEEGADGEDWEEQMLRRGMRVGAGEDAVDVARERVSERRRQQGSVADASFFGGEPTVRRLGADDIELFLAEAVDAVREAHLRNERRLATVRLDTRSIEEEERCVRSALEAKVALVNDAQDAQLLFTELVHMLRVKSPMVAELRTAILASRRSHGEAVQMARIAMIEETVRRVREAGQLIQLGSYTPVAGLLTGESADGEGDRRMQAEAALTQRMDELRMASASLWSDVRPDLRSLSLVLSLVTRFRERQTEQFSRMYVLHSLAALVQPMVAGDESLVAVLLAPCDLPRCNWWIALHSFDLVSSAASSESVLLLPQVLRRVILPYIRDLALAALDPFSSEQGAHLAMALSQTLTPECLAVADVSTETSQILQVFLTALNKTCLPHMKMVAGSISVSFAAAQIADISRCLRNLALLLPFFPQEAITRPVWRFIAEQILDFVYRLLTVPEGVSSVLELFASYLLLFPMQANNASSSEILGVSGRAADVLRDAMHKTEGAGDEERRSAMRDIISSLRTLKSDRLQ